MARRCTWCYEKGHNKRTCPSYTTFLQSKYNHSVEDGSGEFTVNYYRDLLAKRGIDAATGKPLTAEQKKTRPEHTKQKRVCRYCGKGGHNARTCKLLKADRAMLDEIEAEYKIEMYTKVVKENYFPTLGSILHYAGRDYAYGTGYHDVSEFYVVTGFDWSQLNLITAANGQDIPLKYANVSGGTQREQYGHTKCLPSDGERRYHGRVSSGENRERGWKTLSMPAAEANKAWGTPSTDWWDEKTAATSEFYFPKGTERNRRQMMVLKKALELKKDGESIDFGRPDILHFQVNEILGEDWDWTKEPDHNCLG